MLERVWRKGNPCTLWVGMQTGAATVENSMEVHQKNKNKTTIWPRNSTLGYISKKPKNTNLKRHMHRSAQSSIICNCQGMEATQVSIDRWMNKKMQWNISHNNRMKYYSAIKQNEILSFEATQTWRAR